MQKIDNIEIKNFKSIRHQKIEGCKRINVFIGYPNVGKSNILEALSLFSYLNFQSQNVSYKDLCRFKELIDIFNDGDKKKAAELIANGFLFSLKYLSREELDFSIRDEEIDKRDIRITSPETAAGIIHAINLKYSIDKNGNLRHIGSFKNSSYDKPNIKKYQFIARAFNMQMDPTVLTSPFGSNLAEVIRNNSSLRKECGELFANYDLKLVFDENENMIVQKQLDEFSAFQFSILQVADTLQRLIFHKAAIVSNENSVLLFEEPEAHMFPPYIRKLTADIMFDKTNQFFITTHSPFVLSELMEEVKDDLSIYVVDYNKGETIIKRLSDDEVNEVAQYGIDLFFNLESYLDKHGEPHST